MSDKAMPLADARKDALKDTAARRRIAALFDPDTFVEVGALVKNGCDGAGVITGYGLVDGSPVYTFAQDTSVRNGAVGAAHGSKIKKIYELALKSGAPVVGIYDSNGAAIDEGLDAMAAYGDMLCWTNNLSGVVPQVSVVLGPCAGCAAMIAASADFVVASEQAELFLAPGDEACDAKNAALSGVAHLVEKDEAAAVAAARRLIALLPSNNLSALPLCEFREADKAAAALEAAAKAMDKADMMKIIDSVADAGSVIELQKDFTKCGVHVALGTVAGSTVGFVAASDSGKVCSNGSSKIARFVAICDSFQIPVVTFVNCAGFAATNGHAFRGGVREVAKPAHVYAEATTPKIAVICGAAYGSAYVALAGRGANADYAVAWPDAVISALSPATAVAFMEGDKITKDKTRAQVEAEYAANEAGAVAAAAKGHIDDVVDPADTRAAVVSAIDMLIGKRVSRLPKKHANIPM